VQEVLDGVAASQSERHLDLFRALGDAVAAVVAIDVLERLVARVAHAAMHLHRPVGGVAAQPVGPVVAHRDLVADTENAP
jgi:hypothetical protein